MKIANGQVEDICAVIGYTATTTLIDYRGGRNLYIPENPKDAHPLKELIGEPAFRALCREYGSQILTIPVDARRERNLRNRLIINLLKRGVRSIDVSNILGISQRQVDLVRAEFDKDGVSGFVVCDGGCLFPD